ncbi:MAG: DUF2254 domain-containing protein [Candidatus Lokiarchaeota archaeon]|nr:DUF2254 domain-containing protein [Candidatus Lokiarchaeota archaeon]
MKKLSYYWSELKSSFWFIPVLIIILAVALAILFLFIDSQVKISESIQGYFFISNPSSARVVLSTISAAMIGVAGTVFSIILVVLTLTSNQFGSRLIKNFMYIKLNQVVLGSYVSTFAYCLIILSAITENELIIFVPTFSIILAIITAIANIILLIIFIHNVATSIQAENVIADISESLSMNLQTLFPETMGEEVEEEEEEELDEVLIKREYKEKLVFHSLKSGYLRYINTEALFGIAMELDVLIEIYFRPGHYIVKDSEIGLIYSNNILDEEVIKRIQTQFNLGKSRTQQQDAEHAIHQMVEIADRALSPGINDPYTAIACIDNLTSTMCFLANAKIPSRYRFDSESKLRVITDVLTYEGMLDAAFNQIRQYAKGNPSVIIRLMEALLTISKFTKQSKHKKIIRKHAIMLLNVAEQSIEEQNDLKDFKERSKLII